MRNYKKYLVWEKSHQLTLDIYRNTSSFPKEEQFGLISQMKRSSSSVPTNLQKDVGEIRIKIFVDFYILHLVQLTN